MNQLPILEGGRDSVLLSVTLLVSLSRNEKLDFFRQDVNVQ